MPVTVRPSKQFYDKFGEQETNELVTWLSVVETDFRAELREQNERNMARIDAGMARLELGQARFEARMDVLTRDLKLEIADRFTAHARWMMSGWAIVMGTMVALWFKK